MTTIKVLRTADGTTSDRHRFEASSWRCPCGWSDGRAQFLAVAHSVAAIAQGPTPNSHALLHTAPTERARAQRLSRGTGRGGRGLPGPSGGHRDSRSPTQRPLWRGTSERVGFLVSEGGLHQTPTGGSDPGIWTWAPACVLAPASPPEEARRFNGVFSAGGHARN